MSVTILAFFLFLQILPRRKEDDEKNRPNSDSDTLVFCCFMCYYCCVYGVSDLVKRLLLEHYRRQEGLYVSVALSTT